MENFVLNGNGQIDINRKGMEGTYRFHLQEINHNTEICSNKDICDDTATSISSYSNYKQRIDAMFDDSRSVLSDMSRTDRKRKLLSSHNEICKERVIANNIQEKIEKMFEEISVNGLQRHNSGVTRSSQKDHKSSSSSSAESNLKHDFRVTYLGSKPLLNKNVSLMSLQVPLRELYFEYKKKPSENQVDVLTISKKGLKITISGKEELNQFSTIAVWASVKLSFRVTSKATEYAFLPLVTDPDGTDKNLLFRELTNDDSYIIQNNSAERVNGDGQSPIFTVVMKNVNMNKQLECHCFICESSEEAIVIAANLYQALMKNLKKKKEHKVIKPDKNVAEVPKPEENRMKPKVKVKKPAPPIPEIPITESSEEKSSKLTTLQEACNRLSSTENAANEKPANEKISKLLKTEVAERTLGKISQRRGSVPVNIHNIGCEPARTLRRTVSERGGNGILLKDHGDGGDILTKVAIPRSRSFLNANGPLSRFSGRHKTNTKNETVSPLGFKELFNEFRLHEGLESMDDILNAIIDAEGMSFNDLKPIYKEFLLKLAVTLTKDELYQRSKIIMRRQKKRNKKCHFKKNAFMASIGLNKIFRKTASRLGKTKASKPTNLEFTSIVFQSTSKKFESNLPNIKKSKPKSVRVKKKSSSRRRLAKRLERVKNKNISTTSEDSDFFPPKRNTNDSGGGPNRSSSGYFSCSECSCDSENCTCIRTDKCYCNLGNKKCYGASSSDESRPVHKQKSSFQLTPQRIVDHEPEDSLKSCSCDTESCVDSGKCYCTQNKSQRLHNKILHLSDVKGICQTPHLHQKEKGQTGLTNTKPGSRKQGESIFDQLKEQGFAASESTLSRAASPTTAWHTNERNLRQKTGVKPTRSLEYLQINRPQPHQERLLSPQVYPHFESHLLKEIQNTSQRLRHSFIESNKHPCLEREMSFRKHDIQSTTPSFLCRRQYSSMRCRNELVNDMMNSEALRRSVSYRTKNFFNSVRSKHSCDSIMNHIKFPNASCANSSLRFTKRMDVYNSFSENRFSRQDDYVNHSNFKENRRKGIPEHDFLYEDQDRLHINNGNLQRLDYNLFRAPKLVKTESTKMSRKKVLVVSARDPKGKVLYVGTSNRCDSSVKNKKSYVDNSATNASEALAIKKSAEIAALFSDVTSKQKVIHRDFATEQKQSNYRARSNSYRSTNLENTLGYLP